jgi:hypothetical protein
VVELFRVQAIGIHGGSRASVTKSDLEDSPMATKKKAKKAAKKKK